MAHERLCHGSNCWFAHPERAIVMLTAELEINGVEKVPMK